MVKKPKDPHAPKKPLTPFFAWRQGNYQRVQKSMPVGYNFKELAAANSKAWKEVTEAAKTEYDTTYKTEMVTYKKLFNAYKQTNNYAVHQKRLKEHKVQAVKKTKFRKDENHPKRPLSAYFLWMADQREGLTKQGLGHREMLKKCGELWKLVTADEKKPYEEKAAVAKKAYGVKLEKYKTTAEFKQYKEEKDTFMKSRSEQLKKAKKRARDDDDDDAPPKKKAKKSKKKGKKSKSPKAKAKSPKKKPKAPMKAAKAAST